MKVNSDRAQVSNTAAQGFQLLQLLDVHYQYIVYIACDWYQ